MQSIPHRLTIARERAGLTKRGLSRASGISAQRISDLEAAPDGILPPTAKALADALGVDIDEITRSGRPEVVS